MINGKNDLVRRAMGEGEIIVKNEGTKIPYRTIFSGRGTAVALCPCNVEILKKNISLEKTSEGFIVYEGKKGKDASTYEELVRISARLSEEDALKEIYKKLLDKYK